MTRKSMPMLAAARQIEALASTFDDTIRDLYRAAALIDSYPDHTPGAPPPTANPNPHPQPDADVELTTVEAAAHKRDHLQAWAADLVAGWRMIATTLDQITRDEQRARAMTATTTPTPTLCDARGKEGAMLPRTEGGWSDLTCRNTADKAGLCSACYQRCRRWRTAHGLRELAA